MYAFYLLCPIFFGRSKTTPYKRACHQTNSSEGGFVTKVPFSIIFSFIVSFRFSKGHFCYMSFFQGFPGKQVVHLTMHGRGDVVLGYLIAGNEYMFHLFGVLLFAMLPNMIK